MIKRIFGLLMAMLMLLGGGMLPIMAARTTEDAVVAIFSCDTKIGQMVVDTAKKTEGGASLRLPMNNSGFKFASSINGLNVDISQADTLAIDFYLSNPQKIVPAISEMTLELTSSGTFDNAEIAFYLQTVLKAQLSEMKSGWNTVYVYFDSAGRTSKPDEVDLTNINFMRFFGTFNERDGLSGELLLIDNVRVCYTGGPSFDDLENLIQFKGDNSDVTVEVSGIVRPNVNDRHNEITISEGGKLDESERVVVTGNSLKQPSISVNPDEHPTSPSTPDVGNEHVEPQNPSDETGATDMTLVLVIVVCAAVVVIAAAVLVLVLVLAKTKK